MKKKTKTTIINEISPNLTARYLKKAVPDFKVIVDIHRGFPRQSKTPAQMKARSYWSRRLTNRAAGIMRARNRLNNRIVYVDRVPHGKVIYKNPPPKVQKESVENFLNELSLKTLTRYERLAGEDQNRLYKIADHIFKHDPDGFQKSLIRKKIQKRGNGLDTAMIKIMRKFEDGTGKRIEEVSDPLLRRYMAKAIVSGQQNSQKIQYDALLTRLGGSSGFNRPKVYRKVKNSARGIIVAARKLAGEPPGESKALYSQAGEDMLNKRIIKHIIKPTKRNDEAVEYLDEVSKGKMLGYAFKSIPSARRARMDIDKYIDRANQGFIVPEKEANRAGAKLFSRVTGMALVVNRLFKGAKVGETRTKLADRKMKRVPLGTYLNIENDKIHAQKKAARALGIKVDESKNLNELSTKLLRRYMNRASKDWMNQYNARKVMVKNTGMKASDDDIFTKRIEKRNTGIDVAGNKIKKRNDLRKILMHDGSDGHLKEWKNSSLNEISTKLVTRYLVRRGAFDINPQKGTITHPSAAMNDLEAKYMDARKVLLQNYKKQSISPSYGKLQWAKNTIHRHDRLDPSQRPPGLVRDAEEAREIVNSQLPDPNVEHASKVVKFHNKFMKGTRNAVKRLHRKFVSRFPDKGEAENRVKRALIDAETEKVQYQKARGSTPSISDQVKKYAGEPTYPEGSNKLKYDKVKKRRAERVSAPKKEEVPIHVNDMGGENRPRKPIQWHMITGEGRVMLSGNHDFIHKKATGKYSNVTIVASNHPRVKVGSKLSKDDLKALERSTRSIRASGLKEEVVNEISSKTLVSYRKKAMDYMSRLDLGRRIHQKEGGLSKTSAMELRATRVKGIGRANKILAKRTKNSLNEISASTKSSYLTKAYADINNKMNRFDAGEKTRSIARSVGNRTRGINRASDSLGVKFSPVKDSLNEESNTNKYLTEISKGKALGHILKLATYGNLKTMLKHPKDTVRVAKDIGRNFQKASKGLDIPAKTAAELPRPFRNRAFGQTRAFLTLRRPKGFVPKRGAAQREITHNHIAATSSINRGADVERHAPFDSVFTRPEPPARKKPNLRIVK
jgi:hypothetical protein